MRVDRIFGSVLLASCMACAPLLDADFDGLPEGTVFDEVVDLPGPPNGDRMIVTQTIQPTIDDPTGGGDRVLVVFRKPVASVPGIHGEVYFDPIVANAADPIFFSWNGTISDTPFSNNDPAVVAVKPRDLTGAGQPNLFSKLIVRYGANKITVAIPPGDEDSIGNGVWRAATR